MGEQHAVGGPSTSPGGVPCPYSDSIGRMAPECVQVSNLFCCVGAPTCRAMFFCSSGYSSMIHSPHLLIAHPLSSCCNPSNPHQNRKLKQCRPLQEPVGRWKAHHILVRRCVFSGSCTSHNDPRTSIEKVRSSRHGCMSHLLHDEIQANPRARWLSSRFGNMLCRIQ